jgi:hypothetical protein
MGKKKVLSAKSLRDMAYPSENYLLGVVQKMLRVTGS